MKSPEDLMEQHSEQVAHEETKTLLKKTAKALRAKNPKAKSERRQRQSEEL
jgi:hypothetical protein